MTSLASHALPGSSSALDVAARAKNLPAEYFVDPKVADCSRHSHYVHGGLGWSEPYSSWAPICIGCAVGKMEEYLNNPINMKKKLEDDIKSEQDKLADLMTQYNIKGDPTSGYSSVVLSNIEFSRMII